MSKLYLLLKATVTKQIIVPQYTRSDGTIVPAHTKTVHYDPDKSMHDVISGNGTSSQKQAHKKLSSNQEKWNQLSDEDKHAHILSSATNIQVKKTFNGNIAKFKKAILEGKVPQAGHYNAFMSSEMNEEKRAKLLNELKEKVGEDQVNKLMQIASKKAEGKVSGQKVAQEKYNAHASKKAESKQKIEQEKQAKQAKQPKKSGILENINKHLENDYGNIFKNKFKKFVEQNDLANKSPEEQIKLLEKFTEQTYSTSHNQSVSLDDYIQSLKKEMASRQSEQKQQEPEDKQPEKEIKPKGVGEKMLYDMLDSLVNNPEYSDMKEAIVSMKDSEEFQKLPLSEKHDDVMDLFHGTKQVDTIFSILYMAMIAEERKAGTRLGKKIKRLGIHKLLIENIPVREAANFMRGMGWRDIARLCEERGF